MLVLDHAPAVPEPGEGEVRIRVAAAGVGYTDTILRRGRYIGYEGLPLTPGYDVVGIVDKLGPGITGFDLGEMVADMPVYGAYSQYMIRPATDLVRVPTGVDPYAAIEVPLMWMTAWQMLTRVETLPQGAAILVVGASGSMGRALVMLGQYLGYRVIGTCSADNVPLVAAFGATALDCRRTDLADAIRHATDGAGVIAAFDAVGGESWNVSWNVLAQGGILVAYGMLDFLDSEAPSSVAMESMRNLHHNWPSEGAQDGTNRRTTFYDIRIRRGTHPDEYRKDATYLLELIAARRLLPPTAETLPLSQAADAHRRIAEGGLSHRLVLVP